MEDETLSKTFVCEVEDCAAPPKHILTQYCVLVMCDEHSRKVLPRVGKGEATNDILESVSREEKDTTGLLAKEREMLEAERRRNESTKGVVGWWSK